MQKVWQKAGVKRPQFISTPLTQWSHTTERDDFYRIKKEIEDASTALKEALKGTDNEVIKKKTETLVQASMKLGEAIYKSQQNTKPDSGNNDSKDNNDKKDDNVVDADFEEVKEEKKDKDGNQEKSA